MYKKFLISIILGIIPFICLTQEEHNHAIQHTKGSITIKSHIDLLSQKNIKPHTNRQYHYYNKGEIHTSMGGYTGYLLEGQTETTLKNGQLLKSGRFKHGLKVGKWQEWNTNGTFSSMVRWKNGKKRGSFRQFDDNGNLIATGKYKNDDYHGKIRHYQNGEVVKTLKYRKGVLKKEKKVNSKEDKKKEKKKESKKKG